MIGLLRDIDITPNDTLPGTSVVTEMMGGLATYALIACGIGFLVAVVVWAVGGSNDNPHLAKRGKQGVLVALGGAFLIGAAATLINFFSAQGTKVSLPAPVVETVPAGDVVAELPVSAADGAATLSYGDATV